MWLNSSNNQLARNVILKSKCQNALELFQDAPSKLRFLGHFFLDLPLLAFLALVTQSNSKPNRARTQYKVNWP